MSNYDNTAHVTEEVELKVKKYLIMGHPTCCSWFGGGGHKQEVCRFLRVSHFGTRNICGLNDKDLGNFDPTNLAEYGLGCVTVPAKECPLWADDERMKMFDMDGD